MGRLISLVAVGLIVVGLVSYAGLNGNQQAASEGGELSPAQAEGGCCGGCSKGEVAAEASCCGGCSEGEAAAEGGCCGDAAGACSEGGACCAKGQENAAPACCEGGECAEGQENAAPACCQEGGECTKGECPDGECAEGCQKACCSAKPAEVAAPATDEAAQ